MDGRSGATSGTGGGDSGGGSTGASEAHTPRRANDAAAQGLSPATTVPSASDEGDSHPEPVEEPQQQQQLLLLLQKSTSAKSQLVPVLKLVLPSKLATTSNSTLSPRFLRT